MEAKGSDLLIREGLDIDLQLGLSYEDEPDQARPTSTSVLGEDIVTKMMTLTSSRALPTRTRPTIAQSDSHRLVQALRLAEMPSPKRAASTQYSIHSTGDLAPRVGEAHWSKPRGWPRCPVRWPFLFFSFRLQLVETASWKPRAVTC